MFKVILYAVSVLCVSAMAQPSYAEEALREKIKEEMKTRISEKIASKMGSKSDDNQSFSNIQTSITQSGDYRFSVQIDGLQRKYLVHVPPSYNPSNPTPMVMAFHGGGGDMNYMARDEYYGLISKSNKEGFVIVFPNGYSKFEKGIFATWNAGNCCGDARDKKVNDVAFVMMIVANLKRQMNIDSGRIFATGMSNGGMMSYVVACELPDVFKAIAAVAGTDNTVTCSHMQPISVLHIHAQNDDHVLFNGGAGKGAFKDPSKVTNFTSVPETLHRWVSYDKCNPTPHRILTINGAYCDLYTGCTNGKQVKLCVTETGGHSWPGGYKPRGETPSQAVSANDMMWDFFKSQK